MTLPAQRPGNSKQDYATPREFIQAVERRFWRIDWDLAAHERNHVADLWLGPGGVAPDALSPDCLWRTLGGFQWLNPEFSDINPWAHKCSIEAHYGASIALLTPASIGSEWFRRHVLGRALVLGLSPRLSFDGRNPYPKDAMLSVFGGGVLPGFDCWRWDKECPP